MDILHTTILRYGYSLRTIVTPTVEDARRSPVSTPARCLKYNTWMHGNIHALSNPNLRTPRTYDPREHRIYRRRTAAQMPFITINNDAFPFLLFGEASKPMPWNHGTIYSLRLRSSFLRITQRGMQYSRSPAPPQMRSDQWLSLPCTPTHDGLCALAADAGNMVFFPTTEVRCVRAMPARTRGCGALSVRCPRAHSRLTPARRWTSPTTSRQSRTTSTSRASSTARCARRHTPDGP